jgi:hypothetical protein
MSARWVPTPQSRARLSQALAVVVLVAVRWWVTRDRFVYSVTTDEASQLAIARTLSGARPFRLVGNGVDAGFGTLVAPIYAVVDDPELAFRLVLMANVALAVVTLFVLRALLRRIPKVEDTPATWSAAIALLLPGAAMQTPYTGSEVLVVLVIAVVLLLAVMLDEPRGEWAAFGLAVAAASTLLLHSRLALVVGVTVVILVLAVVTKSLRPTVAAGATVVLLVLSWGALQFNEWVYELVWLPGASDAGQFEELLARLGRPLGILASAAGMTWHQLVATFGLVVVGAGHLVATSVGRGSGPRVGPREWPSIRILLVLGAAAAPAAVFMAARGRPWFMVYGRYWDALAVPLVAIGVAFLVSVARRRRTTVFAQALLATAIGGGLFALVRHDTILALSEEYGFGNPRRIAALLAFARPGDLLDVAQITVTAIAAMALVLAVLVVTRRHHRVVAIAVLVLLAAGATVRASVHLNDAGLGLTRWRPAMTLVEDGVLPRDERVAFLLDEAAWDIDPRFPFTGYQFYEPDVEFVGLEADDLVDYDYAVAPVDDPLLRQEGWAVVFEHPNGLGTAVWARP